MSAEGHRSAQEAERADNDPQRVHAVVQEKKDRLLVAAAIAVLSTFGCAVLLGLVGNCFGVGASDACGPGTLVRIAFRLAQICLLLTLVAFGGVAAVRFWRT